MAFDSDHPVVLGAGASFSGLLSFRGTARIDGELDGEVIATGRLVIGEGARVKARIEIDELVVGGEVEGEIEARERLEVKGTGRVQGSVRTPRLAVAEGAVVEARCVTGSASASGTKPAPGVAQAS